jgi:hypothetical protein
MKMILAFAVLAASVTFAGTAAFGQKLYPVQGPLASQTPPPVFSAQVKRALFGAGSVTKYVKTFMVADGELVNGKFVQVTAAR